MNPEGQMRLSDSVKLIGLCTEKCPEYERVRRIVEDDVKPPECVRTRSLRDSCYTNRCIDGSDPTPPAQAAHTRRRAHGQGIRPVGCGHGRRAGLGDPLAQYLLGMLQQTDHLCMINFWQKTLDYLMQRLDDDEFDFLHSWIWDRTRAIRKDLRTQRIEQRTDISLLLTCLERSARFLLLSAHQMARSTQQDYSHQQDIEQLNATLMSLQERYIDNRRIGYPSAHEAEFWAYRLILAPLYTNTQLENELHGLPSDLRHNPRVHTAIEIYRTLNSVLFQKESRFVQAQANWKRFWELISSPSVSYLMACAAEISFQRVRHVVLDTLWRVYRVGTTTRPHTVESWTTDKLQEVLGLDSESEVVELCQLYKFDFGTTNEGLAFLDVTAKGFDRRQLGRPENGVKPQLFSQGIVEKKRYDRKFSAIVQAMSIHEAKTHGLMIDSPFQVQADGRMEDETSLFVSEHPAVPNNIFAQPNRTSSSDATLKPATNAFTPKNPFATPVADAAARGNPFIAPQLPSFQASQTGVQPGTFDPSKDTIKFATPATTVATSDTGNPFKPLPSSTPSFSFATAVNNPTPTGNFFLNAAKSQSATATPASNNIASFGTPTFTAGSPSPSFTPIGTPAQVAPALDDKKKFEAEEQGRQRKAEAEAAAEAQRHRAQEEAVRQAKEAAKRQRIEAEQRRQHQQQQERERVAREARERQKQEEEARLSHIRKRESAWAALTANIMFGAGEGLMLHFIENEVMTTAQQYLVKEDEDKKQRVWEEKKRLAEKMYQQRELGFKRLVMASWVAKVEKKKRAQQARERRKRLKEQRSQLVDRETILGASHGELQGSNGRLVDDTAFRKPAAPASARRARRTEERRGNQAPQQSTRDFQDNPRREQQPQDMAAHAALTPISMSNSLTSGSTYSEAYQISTAPIDRTETDWFQLRAMGIDPSKHRKRSFDSSSDGEGKNEVEPKRPKMSPSIPHGHLHSQHITAEEQLARFRAMQESFRKSNGSTEPVNGTTSAGGHSSLNERSAALIQRARQLIGNTPKPNISPPTIQHSWSRSVPNFGSSTSSGQQSAFGKSMVAAPQNGRPAYWNRKSRFVPQHLYGQGPEAVRAYREEYGLNSPASTRPASAEPSVSSPIPTQQLYIPPNGYTQEQYSGEDDEEEASGVEVIDVDAEDEEAVTSEEEYEGEDEDEEDQQPQPLPHRQPGHQPHYEQDGGSSTASDEEVEYTNGYADSQHGQYEEPDLEVYEYSSDEDEEDEDMTQQHFAQPAQSIQPIRDLHRGKQHTESPDSQLSGRAGATEDDAIELSD